MVETKKAKKKPGPKKGTGGRPPVDIDQKIFEGMLEIMCTCEEVAGIFRCSHDAIENYSKRQYGENFGVISKRFGAYGKRSLRRWMFEAAKKGNASIMIWLSKQHLGMTDQPVDEARREVYTELESLTDD